MDENLILWPQDAKALTDAQVTKATKMATENSADNNKLAYVTVGQVARVAANEVEMSGVDLGPISGGATAQTATAVANGPAGKNRRYEASPGFYTINGSTVEAAARKRWILWWNGSTWSLVDMGTLTSARTKLDAWTAGTYTAGDAVVVGKLMYIANKTTTSQPPSADWNLIGSELDKPGGALSFDTATSGVATIDIPTPRDGIFWNENGGDGAFGWYVSSAKFDLNKGDTVSIRSMTENLGNPGIIVFDPAGNIIKEENVYYAALNTVQTLTYTATENRKIGINFMKEPTAGMFKRKLQALFLKPEHLDQNSALGVASFKTVNDIKRNAVKQTKIPEYKSPGLLLPAGGFRAEESLYRYTDPIKVKAGEVITARMQNQDNGGTNVIGWVLNNDLTFRKTLLSQKRIQPINETTYRYEVTEEIAQDGFILLQAHVMNKDNPAPWGELVAEAPIFLSVDNIGQEGEFGVASQTDMQYLLNNGGSIDYGNSIFRNIGLMGSQGGVNPTIPNMRYSDMIYVPNGATITATVAPENYDAANPFPLMIIFDSNGETVIDVKRATQAGMNTVTYEAKENVYVVLNHLAQNFFLKNHVSVSRPRIYATPDQGGGGGGQGRYIPDVMRYNPVDLIRMDLTTTDPIPTAKGTYMKGQGTLLIDGVIITRYMRLEVQGSSSAGYPQKNWTIEMFSDSAYLVKAPFRIANLLPHDEYVMKANYIEPNHVCNITANRVWEQMMQTRDGFPKRDTDQKLIGKIGSEAMETGALGHVDGYSMVLYLNGEFYGLGTFNIGKKYQNYDLTKDDPACTQFELSDAANYYVPSGIELRNPKTRTPEVDAVLTKFGTLCATPLAQASTAFRRGFATRNIVDMYLFLDFFKLVDCVSRNNHWMTYDSGETWLVTPYDLDTWYKSWNGGEISAPTGRIWPGALNVPANTLEFWETKVWAVYQEDIKSRYKQLRGMGVFSADNVYTLARDLSIKFTRELYAMDKAKWPDKSDWSMGIQNLATWMRTRINYLDGIYGY